MTVNRIDLDQHLIVLGTDFTEVSAALRQDLDDATRCRLLGRWLDTLAAMAQPPAATATGRRIKAAAILACADSADRPGAMDAAWRLALSLCGDELMEDG